LQTAHPTVTLPAHVKLAPRSIHWVRPQLVVEVEHRGWGKNGLIRQASFQRLRSDKAVPAAQSTPAPAVTLTHPERVVFPRPRWTKREVATYYESVADWLQREVRGRPGSLLRAPEGLKGATFFQKHADTSLGRGVRSIAVREQGGKERAYLTLETATDLLALVQMNALEFHPWGVEPGQPDHPDRIIFDLDPGPGLHFTDVFAAALEIRDHLHEVGLRSYPMLSGGKGVHVFVPLQTGETWAAVKGFARALARVLTEHQPGRYVSVASKARRERRLFIDWLRNARGATSVAPWSLRARAGAPVAMPVAWDDLETFPSGAAFALPDALAHTRALSGHPWGDYRARAQRLPRARHASDPSR
jgi:bifunctional non-homologous end joining protein LigD